MIFEFLAAASVAPPSPSWKCEGCTPDEKIALAYIQERTNITDRNALATIMGNIKQESQFKSNICEGGARVAYNRCYSGGYGLIQWTTAGRYYGLGSFCKNYGCDPSSLKGQLRYMVNENQFQKNLPYFEGSGMTVGYYMNAAYSWLGWGIHGARTNYAYDYTKKFSFS
ncbi:MAG: phage tail tip lysozyme [Prochlorococcus sp.]